METTNEKNNIDLTRVRLTPQIINMINTLQTEGISGPNVPDKEFNNSGCKRHVDDISDIVYFFIGLNSGVIEDDPDHINEMLSTLYYLRELIERFKAPVTKD